MRLKEIEARLAAIRTEMNNDSADLDALTAEVNSLLDEKRRILGDTERRTALLASIASGEVGEPIVKPAAEQRTATTNNWPTMEQRDRVASAEYRSAFLKNLAGSELSKEERAAFTHTTANTAAPLPTTMLNQIWDNISNQHSIMGDITIYRTGTILEVVKHTEVVQGKAAKTNEGSAATDEKNTLVKVTLSGNDFSKTVKISYAMSAMSIDAFETYIATEISASLGEVMAEDAVTTIKSGINAANKKTTAAVGVLTYKECASIFACLKRANSTVVYANTATVYNHLVGMVDDTGRPIFQPSAQAGAMGLLIGGMIKIEDAFADGEIAVGDPKKVVYNMVQDIIIESEKDIENHVIKHSGYARGEGALIDDKSFAILTVKTA